MADPVELSGDVIAGGTALGGLLLVYLGSVVISFTSYDRTAQAAVKTKHLRRAWFASLAIILCMLAAGLALVAKWSANDCMAASAIILLLVALTFGAIAGVLLALDVK